MQRMLSATTLLAAIAAAYSSGAAAQQQTPRNDLRDLRNQSREPATAIYGSREVETPESRSPQKPRPQPSRENALRSESRDSGLARTPYTAITTSVRIEQIPVPFGAENALRLIGKSAVSRRGEKVGEIFGVVRSPDGGLLAVVDAGEFLDVRMRPVALPIEPDRIDSNGNLRVQASRKELQSLPVFATNLIDSIEATDAADEVPRLAADLQRQRSESESESEAL